MFSILKLKLLIVAVLICLVPSLMADTVQIAINSGFGADHKRVDGSITTGNGTVTISIENTLSNLSVISIAQNISAIYLRVDGYDGGASLLSSASENSIALYMHVGWPIGEQDPTPWIVQNNVNGWLGVCTICAVGPQPGPDWTIIGGNPGLYLLSNGSLNNNRPHNPYLSGMVQFVLGVPGVTEDSNIRGYYIQFGTTSTPPAPAPDSSSLSLLLLGGTVVGAAIARKRFNP